MKDYLVKDEWAIIEDKFHPEFNQISESIFSIGNGHMGQRANFEESFSGQSLQGSYVGGIYYPDKTRVGWWKNGYPEYFAKVLNSCNWIGIEVKLNDISLDLNKCQIENFIRKLDMKNGLLFRSVDIITPEKHKLTISSERFCSMDQLELGVLQYKIKSTSFTGKLSISSYLDFDVMNQDANYDERFWDFEDSFIEKPYAGVSAKTKKTNFLVLHIMSNDVYLDGTLADSIHREKQESKVSENYIFHISSGNEVVLEKRVFIGTSRDHNSNDIKSVGKRLMDSNTFKTYSDLRASHSQKWHQVWEDCDIIIEGDIAAQQGIRFNIFQLYQTYSGHDDRLNIGPKGFTGEKYGGSTYWDTEAYCLPFYLSTTNQNVARNLLIYRYNHLEKAIENAQKLGFENGAALYPMVTMNGEECHNEWEITFEEIHRNGAIAYGIYDYINYTGDQSYLLDYGTEVLIGIARFWAQRVNFSEDKDQYVMLGVTGPNEYENNVNNNWYTNYIAVWCLKYAKDAIKYLKDQDINKWTSLSNKLNFEVSEINRWDDIISQMYFPEDTKRNVFLQQDGYLDKEQHLVTDLSEKDRPLNQNWSWDRILRSCFIKQADVLQGLYFFEDDFSLEQHMSNFKFYEPRTVHESSLSPCVHSILASKLGLKEKAYEMYLRTSRLDLDDYNNDTEDGLHITSMAGTWLSIVKGFGGMRVKNEKLYFNTNLPQQWKKLSFIIKWRGNKYKVVITHESSSLQVIEGNKDHVSLNHISEYQVI